MTTLASPQPLRFLKLLSHDVRWHLLSVLARSDYRVQELVSELGQPANLVSYHLKQLRAEQLVKERRSSADGRDVYYSLNMGVLREGYLAAGDALHPALGAAENTTSPFEHELHYPPVRILFLCTQNSARSQMAEALMRNLGESRVEVFSAGSQPSRVHPDAIRIMRAKFGIDINSHRAKHYDEFAGQSFDYIITVCDRVREVCPAFPGDSQQIHWSFADPAEIDDPDDRFQAFEKTGREMVTRIHLLLIIIDRAHREKQ